MVASERPALGSMRGRRVAGIHGPRPAGRSNATSWCSAGWPLGSWAGFGLGPIPGKAKEQFWSAFRWRQRRRRTGQRQPGHPLRPRTGLGAHQLRETGHQSPTRLSPKGLAPEKAWDIGKPLANHDSVYRLVPGHRPRAAAAPGFGWLFRYGGKAGNDLAFSSTGAVGKGSIRQNRRRRFRHCGPVGHPARAGKGTAPQSEFTRFRTRLCSNGSACRRRIFRNKNRSSSNC